MKSFIKIFLLCAVAFVTVAVFASNRTKQGGTVNQGEYKAYGGQTGDTIVVSDTVNYVYMVAHSNVIWPVLDIKYQKVGTGNPTFKVEFFQSIDGVNYFAVAKGKAQGAYSKSFSPTATGYLQCSFKNDTALFEGRYLKVTYTTSNTASTKAKLTNHLKINVN